MEICPICLKKNKTISIINNDLYEENEEVIQEYENIVHNQNTNNEINRNRNRNRNNILQIDEDLRRYYELRKVLMMITCIFIFCIILLKILLN
jgi:DNA replication initiation complex subunit (GINS family)